MAAALLALAALIASAQAVFYNINHTRPVIFGLRGAGGASPPNTLQSYADALANGAHGIAADVQATSDGVAVLFAGADLSATTNCSGSIASMSLADVQRCSACPASANLFCLVPTLAQMLDLVFMMRGVAGPVMLYPRAVGTVDAVLAALDKSAMGPGTWVAAASDDIAQEYAQHAPGVLRARISPQTGSPCFANASVAFWTAARQAGLAGAGCTLESLTSTLLARAHTQHIASIAWIEGPVSNASLQAAALDGVDMLVTTDPIAAALIAGITRTPPPPPPSDPAVTVTRFTAQVPRQAGGIMITVSRSAAARMHTLPPFGFPACDGRAPVTWSAQAYGCVAATNAGFFDERGDRCQGRLIARGVDVSQPPGAPTEAAFAITHDGVAIAGMLSTANATAKVYREYISGSNVLVFGGKIVPCDATFTSCDERAPRTTVGVMSNGDIVIVSVDGLEATYLGPTLPEMSAILAQRGVWAAINLDGGGSTTTTLNGQVANKPTCIDTVVSCERAATSILCVSAP